MVSHTTSSAADFRTHRIKLAALTSVGSKFATMAVQLLAMPMAVRALGVEKFGVYAMLAAGLSWMNMAQLGIGSGLTLGISSAAAKGDRQAEAGYFSSAFFMILAVSLTVGTVLISCVWLLPIAHLFGHGYAKYALEIRRDLTVLALFLVTKLILSVFDAAQAGYQEHYICNLWAMLGNSLSLVGLLTVALFHPSIVGIILAISGMPLLADMCNGGRLIGSVRGYLRPKLRNLDYRLSKALLSNGIAFSTTVISSFLMYQLSVLMMGRMQGPKSAATFAVMIQALSLATGVITMFAQPLWPALTDAAAQNDIDWLHNASRRIIRYSMVYATTIGLVLMTAGHQIIDLWYSSKISITQPLLVAFGLYFILGVWENVYYNILIGLNELRIPALLMVTRSILMVCLAPPLIRLMGSTGMALSLCIAQLLICTWSFPLLARNALQRLNVSET